MDLNVEPEGTKFYESWCGPLEKGAIKYAVESIDDSTKAYMEVGCFEGRSAVFTANLVHPTTLICIDPWVPVEYAPYEVAQYSTRNIQEIFNHNITVGTKGNVEVHQIGWEEYFENNTPEISYLYLDGPHGYNDVKDSLNIIVPWIVKGGVLIGDDYDDSEVKNAVDDFFEKEMTHPTSHRTFYWKNKEK